MAGLEKIERRVFFAERNAELVEELGNNLVLVAHAHFWTPDYTRIPKELRLDVSFTVYQCGHNILRTNVPNREWNATEDRRFLLPALDIKFDGKRISCEIWSHRENAVDYPGEFVLRIE